MENLTLLIPAKKEKESLPTVLNELQNFKGKILIVIDKTDKETEESISNYKCEILYQSQRGYGAALIEGIKNIKTKYFCIFNADGSFNPKELEIMYSKILDDKNDLVFASRYEKNCSSEDDTFITFIGNYFFTYLGKILFKLKISDILYTFVLGNTEKVKNLNLDHEDFSFCVELPIKSLKNNLNMTTSKSNERSRIGGKKKVNAFRDGFLILFSMIKLFIRK